jgi:hypothetical protein
MLKRTGARWLTLVVIAAIACLPVSPALAAEDFRQPDALDQPWESIDLAIILDTSGSMDKLIDAARLKLWEIVHDLTLLEPTPKLRVALMTFGNNKNRSRPGWISVETGLTQDLDLVSERLFGLTSQGGTEYVGRALKIALDELEWTPSDEALKMIFIAGNEDALQDQEVDLLEMGYISRQDGILVHPIFCGHEKGNGAESWVQLAETLDAELSIIDHRRGTVVVKTPYDAELAELSEEISATYIPLGEQGVERQKNRRTQDRNARKLSQSAAAGRAEIKTSPLFTSRWDLVDALAAGVIRLEDLDESRLPDYLAAMTPDERAVYIEDMQFQREELRQRIRDLSRERRRHVSEQVSAKGLDDSRSFDAVLRQKIREQLEAKGWEPPEE